MWPLKWLLRWTLQVCNLVPWSSGRNPKNLFSLNIWHSAHHCGVSDPPREENQSGYGSPKLWYLVESCFEGQVDLANWSSETSLALGGKLQLSMFKRCVCFRHFQCGYMMRCVWESRSGTDCYQRRKKNLRDAALHDDARAHIVSISFRGHSSTSLWWRHRRSSLTISIDLSLSYKIDARFIFASRLIHTRHALAVMVCHSPVDRVSILKVQSPQPGLINCDYGKFITHEGYV